MYMDANTTEKMEKSDLLRSEFTETEKVILRRRSVRNYKKKQVPEFMIKRILEAGRFAPSAGNCQPWKFIVLREPEIINGITDTVVGICKIFKAMIDYRITGSFLKRRIANLFIRLKPADLHPTPFGAISLIADGKLGLYHGSPTVILIFKDVRGISNPDLDCGIAGQNMVLAAHSMGLGTCWVGFTKLAFQYTGKWKKRLNIGYPYKFANSLSIGWPVGEPDGMVERPVHPVEWHENGIVQTVY
jgi:nitroreductase